MKKTSANRILALFIALLTLLALAGCKREPQAVSPTAKPSDQSASSTDAANGTDAAEAPHAPIEYDPADDFQNRFGTCPSTSIWENDEMLLFSVNGEYYYIGYYDKAADVYGVLCGKTECEHDHLEKNKDCNGYAQIRQHLGSMNGRIYFVADNHDANPWYTALYSMNPDATDRREELRLPDQEVTGSLSQCYLHRGYLYLCSRIREVVGGEPEDHPRFSRINVNTGEYEIIFEDGNENYVSGMCFVGSNVYMYTSYPKELMSGNVGNVIKRFNAETGELKTVLEREEEGYEKSIFRIWVDKEENVYYSTMQRPETVAVIYTVDVNGNPKPFMDFADEDILFDFALFSEDIVLVLGVPEGGDPKAFWLWVRDLEGNTVFKGEFPRSPFLEELGIEEDYGFSDIQGDRNALYVCFQDTDISQEKWNTTPILGFVRYEIVSTTELRGKFVYKSLD